MDPKKFNRDLFLWSRISNRSIHHRHLYPHCEATIGIQSDDKSKMMHEATILFATLFVSIVVVIANDNEGEQNRLLIGAMNLEINTPQLNMTLCVDKCAGENCKSYIIPISTCYGSSELFPNDPSWSGKDVRDDVICQTLVRTIFDTENSTCLGIGDTFEIPMNECVGPFGKPRPWGSFALVKGQDAKDGNVVHGSGVSSLC